MEYNHFKIDDGAKDIKKKLKGRKPIFNLYYHYVENLYVMFAPSKKDKAIEDLFNSNTLDTKIDGKIFSRAKKIDTSKEYGKNIFAEKVIKANQKEIDFKGFKEIFDNFKLIVEDYKKKIQPPI